MYACRIWNSYPVVLCVYLSICSSNLNVAPHGMNLGLKVLEPWGGVGKFIKVKHWRNIELTRFSILHDDRQSHQF